MRTELQVFARIFGQGEPVHIPRPCYQHIYVPEPYQAGDCSFRAFPPIGWGVTEADLFWRDWRHDHLWRGLRRTK